MHYFGRWGRVVNGQMTILPEGGAWREALALYKEQRDDLEAGLTPKPKDADALTVAALCNHFLTAKHDALEIGEIVNRTFADYKRITDRLVAFFGKHRLVEDLNAGDFARLRKHLADKVGPVRLTSDISMVKSVFKFGYESDLIAKHVKMGPQFRPPKKHVLRKHRADKGLKMFEADELHLLLDAASVQMRAMILLGVNCGFGNHDCGSLPLNAVNFADGWIDFPRPKSGIARRIPLWEETIEALALAKEQRSTPTDDATADLLFITKYGQSWAKDSSANPISAEFRKLCQSVKRSDSEKASLYRAGRSFYALRPTFETVAGDSNDQVAVNAIMGHVDSSMAAVYREKISDERLIAVANHVHDWLWPAPAEPAKKAEPVHLKLHTA